MSPRIALLLAGAITLAAISLGLAVKAEATEPAPHLVAELGDTECWDGSQTLVHVIVRNTGTATGSYVVTSLRQNGTTETTRGRLRAGEAENAGYVVRKRQTLSSASVRDQDQNLLYYRLRVTGLPRCVR